MKTKIYEALKTDHRKVLSLLDQLVASSERGNSKWKNLVTQIRDELIPHSRAEEAVFYNPIRDSHHGNGLVAHGFAEHAMAETELRALQAMKAIDANWTALATKLRTDIAHHIEHEEGKIFSAGRATFSDEEAEQIADAFHALKPIIRDQSIVGTSIDLLTNLLPRRLREGLRSNLANMGNTKKSA